jgi:hypothetical protein
MNNHQLQLLLQDLLSSVEKAEDAPRYGLVQDIGTFKGRLAADGSVIEGDAAKAMRTTGGRLREVYLDAHTGAILDHEEDD